MRDSGTRATGGSHPVTLARIYDSPASTDGQSPPARILVDRLWPRGMSRDRAALDLWLREIAPSNELRIWYGHDPALYIQFRARFLDELTAPERAQAMETLREYVERGPVVLLTATKEIAISHAAVLVEVLTTRAP